MQISQFCFVALLGLPSLAYALAPPPVEGIWTTKDNKAVVRIYDCGNAVCGTIIKSGNPNLHLPTTDINNADPALRGRPLIGLQIITNLKPKSDHWSGVIYSPEDGRSYNATFVRLDGSALKVKGCWGFICVTQFWKQAS